MQVEKLTAALGDRSAQKRKFLILLASTSMLVFCRPAFADDGQIQKLEAEIQRIEARHQAEISALRSEIHELRRQRPAGVLVMKGEPIVPAGPGPHVIMAHDRGYHFGFASPDERNTLELIGRLHIDTGGYLGYNPALRTADREGLASGINFRRARIGVVGKFMGDWHYAFIYDFGNTADGYNINNALANANSTTIPGDNNNFLSGIENAYITYNGFYNHGGPFPVAIDLPGVQDVPWTLEEATSSNDIMFMERSSAQVVATEFGGGDFRTAAGVHSNNNRYWVGAYLTGPNAGALHTNGASCIGTAPPCTETPTGNGPQLSALFRASYQVVQTQNASLHLGFNFADLFDPRVGPNSEGIQLYDRPELRVDPTYFLNTGYIPAHNGQVFGAEAAGAYQNFFVQGEYYHYIIDTLANTIAATPAESYAFLGGVPGPVLNFNGGYVEGSYTFGGKRLYNPATGAYTGVIPQNPLDFGTLGWGALELAGRYSVVDLNDPNLTTQAIGGVYSVPGTISGSGATYGGGKQTAYGAGLNWYPNLNMKFMLDYEHVVVDNPQFFGGPNWRGATIDWVAGRTQIVF